MDSPALCGKESAETQIWGRKDNSFQSTVRSRQSGNFYKPIIMNN